MRAAALCVAISICLAQVQVEVHGFVPCITRACTSTVSSSTSTGGSARRSTSPLHISLEDEWSDLANQVTKSTKDVDLHVELDQITKQISEIEWMKLLTPGPAVNQLQSVGDSLITAYLRLPLWEELAFVLLPLVAITTSTLYALSFPADDFREGFEPYPRGEYDSLQAKVYYSKHPFLVLQRALQLLRLSNRYLINVLIDKYVFRDEESVRPKRAQELLNLVNKAGPTAIKVGQVRTLLLTTALHFFHHHDVKIQCRH